MSRNYLRLHVSSSRNICNPLHFFFVIKLDYRLFFPFIRINMQRNSFTVLTSNVYVGDESEPAPQAAPERAPRGEHIRLHRLRRAVPAEESHVHPQVTACSYNF